MKIKCISNLNKVRKDFNKKKKIKKKEKYNYKMK